MKKLILSLSPVNIIKRLILIIKEISMFVSYVKTINNMEKELEDSKIVKFSRHSLGKAINLKPETLLLASKHESDMTDEEKKELNKLELSFISKEISKHNDIFINNGIIELIKTKAISTTCLTDIESILGKIKDKGIIYSSTFRVATSVFMH